MRKVRILRLVGVVNASVIERVHKCPSVSSRGMIGDCGGWNALEAILSGRGGERSTEHPESLAGLVLAMGETIHN